MELLKAFPYLFMAPYKSSSEISVLSWNVRIPASWGEGKEQQRIQTVSSGFKLCIYVYVL